MTRLEAHAKYRSALARAQRDAGVTCDADLSPKERAEGQAFDDARRDIYNGRWPARAK